MEDSLHYLIMANRMLVQRGLLERLKNTGLTIGQPKVLDYLKDHDGSSQKEIARNCFLEAGSLTSILNRMEEKGLIERRMLNGNRRTFHIYLTKEGWKSQKLVEESFLEIEKQALKGITEEEFDAYLTFSRKIFKNLMLTEEEMDIVLETGKNLGYLDVEAQMGHLKNCRMRLEGKPEAAQREFVERRRVYRYLGVAVGVMVILVLI